MNAHHPDAAFSVSVVDQRHAKTSSLDGEFADLIARTDLMMSNVYAIGKRLARPLYRLNGPIGSHQGDPS
jgi:hypothetical protein